MSTQPQAAAFVGLIDLASERLGGKALAASDDFFAEKENLLKPGRGIFIEDKFTERGKWMDGWETRRRRGPGHDWCIIRLGFSGVIRGVDIDTNHFLGNHPSHASMEACAMPGDVSTADLAGEGVKWTEILPRSSLNPGAQNIFTLSGEQAWTHVRLNIFPDGGVARLRVYGEVAPDFSRLKKGVTLDLAAVENGGRAVSCSDMFFSSMNNLLLPGRALNMGDGWETKRRRGPGNDWVIVKLGRAGLIRRLEVDTQHFKGNFPDQCSVEGCHSPGLAAVDALTWTEILPKTKLKADHQHVFEKDLKDMGPCTHVRLNIYPDGGVSRLRVYGTLT